MKLFLIGYMGAGKTTVGRIMAEKANCSFIDIDSFIENRYNKAITKIFEEKGEAGFREIEHRALQEISAYENIVVSTGGGLPCFFDNMELMNKKGITIYLKENIDELTKRLNSSKQNRPLIKEKNLEELQKFIEESLKERELFYNQANIIFEVKKCTTKQAMNQWVKELLSQLSEDISNYYNK